MAHPRVTPKEAQRLLEDQGFVYLDVRSEPEFAAGHPSGAFNIPYKQPGRTGMELNPEFVRVVSACFGPGTKLLLGCRSGRRSLEAAEALRVEGFEHIAELATGFSGITDPFGDLLEPGWRDADLPVATEPEPGRSYPELRARLERAR